MSAKLFSHGTGHVIFGRLFSATYAGIRQLIYLVPATADITFRPPVKSRRVPVFQPIHDARVVPTRM